ncbi:hypothetical protein H310_02992 [Aphanomyces invadans]|uniref:Uncharacterized protein n=1 Tax=Aphanomyces invadans TaxID=157072 RepID=A0A024UKN4_9STRA|nr:hypothetical protein H310_02992 [Aphanomyces invadans]ETW06859.1 hypothetical protein H310_02992 [Aphanomyces invadans]|eukprot:XP_008864934.1 hypothetical protein H310_02992 [Aphanomyces invadans]
MLSAVELPLVPEGQFNLANLTNVDCAEGHRGRSTIALLSFYDTFPNFNGVAIAFETASNDVDIELEERDKLTFIESNLPAFYDYALHDEAEDDPSGSEEQRSGVEQYAEYNLRFMVSF